MNATEKKRLVQTFFMSLCLIIGLHAGLSAQTVFLTPKPQSATLGSGEFVFGESTDVLYPTFEGDSIKAVIENFATSFRTATGKAFNLWTTATNAPFVLTMNNSLATEEYKLTVTSTQVSIEASKPVGFFHALQSIKQLMPAALAAGKADKSITKWAIPAITVSDKPRFGWRGFMLDCGRHFFSKEEVKRVIDIMATYKMNRFHWHLTEDQGWRIEIKKYPKLTSVGSIRKSSQIWSDPEGVYHDFIPYGPYFYTQEDIKEVVAYAKERFVEIIPEVDMPGHFQAAMAAYPEYSCTPSAKHEVWIDYGISGDVLNVANPAAVTFVKDILDELITLFPYKYIHIGGDECPTGAWQNNTQCQQLLASLGSTNYRDLQTNFFKQIENHLKSKTNPADQKRVIAWNETLGGDLTGSNVTIMSWINWVADSKKAANLGLDVIMTPQIPYYINRKQSSNSGEPFSQGSGSETVEAVYAYEPIPSDATAAQIPYYKGVQGNFWTEHVYQDWVLEYLMLPRIAAIAETGWTPKINKNFTDFVSRIRRDTTLYQLNGWSYGKHYMSDSKKVMPATSNAQESHWFRLISTCTDAARLGKCVELLAEGSPLIAANTTAAVNRLWSNTPAAEGAANYNYQWWCLKEDPANPGTYALINKAQPNGSVNPNATAAANTGRWNYDAGKVNYNFVLGESYAVSGTTPSYSIRSKNYPALYMNLAASGQQYSINLWGNPLDGNSGMFVFKPFLEQELDSLKSTLTEVNKCLTYPTWKTVGEQAPGRYSAEQATALSLVAVPMDSIYKLNTSAEISALKSKLTTALKAFKSTLVYPAADKSYYIVSTKIAGAKLYNADNNMLKYSTDSIGEKSEWIISSVTPVDGAMAIRAYIKNKNTNRCPGQNSPVELGTTAYYYNITFNETYQDWELTGSTISNKNRIFPIPSVSPENPFGLSRDASVRALGTGWQFVPVSKTSTKLVNPATIGVKIYSKNKRILVEGTTGEVNVFTAQGMAVPYWKDKKFENGVYLVKAGKAMSKVVVE